MPSPHLPYRFLAAIAALAAACAAHAAEGPDATREIERLYRGGDTALAFQRLDQALAAQANNPRLRFLRGVMLSETRREAEAITVFERLTQDYPELPEPYNNLAVLHAAGGRLDRARELLEQALRYDPSYFAALENLGDVFVGLAQRAYEQAGANPRAEPGLQRKLKLVRDFATR